MFSRVYPLISNQLEPLTVQDKVENEYIDKVRADEMR